MQLIHGQDYDPFGIRSRRQRKIHEVSKKKGSLKQHLRFRFWGRSGPEAGFFPFVISIVIVVSSLFITGKCFLSRIEEEKIRKKQEDNGIKYFWSIFLRNINTVLLFISLP
jgi:hypothetical protein